MFYFPMGFSGQTVGMQIACSVWRREPERISGTLMVWYFG